VEHCLAAATGNNHDRAASSPDDTVELSLLMLVLVTATINSSAARTGHPVGASWGAQLAKRTWLGKAEALKISILQLGSDELSAAQRPGRGEPEAEANCHSSQHEFNPARLDRG